MNTDAQSSDPRDAFVVAACVPRDRGHTSGTLEEAEAILRQHPHVAAASIYTAAVLGDDVAVGGFLSDDPGSATARGGPHGWDALTYLCFSRYLRLKHIQTGGFTRAARLLLDAGADPNTGWWDETHTPEPEWESVLYGAAGVAHNPELAALLLDRGADPNDGEVTYHAPESWDNDCLKAMLATGRLTDDSLATMLLRKCDWHDLPGVKLLLEHGADPNRPTRWRRTAFQQALARDNAIEIVEAMMDHGADPAVTGHPDSPPAASIAALRGRRDVLEVIRTRGTATQFGGVERLVAACALNDESAVREISQGEPRLAEGVIAQGGTLLAEFAGNGNTEGVRLLLDLGVPVDALYEQGDGYFGIATRSTALHVTCWRASHNTVKLLIGRGAPVDVRDDEGQTPLMLAVRACVDSYWTGRRSPESVEALLRAGASIDGVGYPSGYAEVDRLLGEAIA